MKRIQSFVLLTFLLFGTGTWSHAQDQSYSDEDLNSAPRSGTTPGENSNINISGISASDEKLLADENTPILLRKAILMEKKQIAAASNGEVTDASIKEAILNNNSFSVLKGAMVGDVWFNTDPLNITKMVLNFGVGMIPVVGDFLNLFISLFWPTGQKTDIFESIKSKIQNLVSESIDGATWKRLSAKVDEIGTKMAIFNQMIKEKNWEEVHNQFAALSEILISIESDFRLKGESRPFFFIPLYRATVDLVAAFRLSCIREGKTYHLSDSEIKAQKLLLKDLVFGVGNNGNGAISYIKEQKTILADYVKDALNDVPADYTGNTKYNNIIAIYDYYLPALSGENILEARANNPLDNSYINFRLALPTNRVGDLGQTSGVTSSFALFNIMNDIETAGDNDYATITKIVLSEMKPGQPFYKRIAGMEVYYDNGYYDHQGYFGGDPGALQKSYSMDFTKDNVPAKVSTYNRNLYMDQFVVTDSKGNTLSAGNGKGATPLNISGNLYKLGKMFFDDDRNTYSGHQAAGASFTFVWDNTAAKNTSYDEIKDTINHIHY